MKTLLRVALGAALFAGSGLLANAADVKTDFDKHADFSRIHTYSWGSVSTSNPLFVNRIKDEVNKNLQEKGWQLVESGGDATIFAKGNVHNQQELQTYYNGFPGGWGGRWGWGGWGWRDGWGDTTTTTLTNHPVGSLVLDIFDAKSKDLIFRGISAANLHDDPEKNTKELDKDIDKMFDHFPPKDSK